MAAALPHGRTIRAEESLEVDGRSSVMHGVGLEAIAPSKEEVAAIAGRLLERIPSWSSASVLNLLLMLSR